MDDRVMTLTRMLGFDKNIEQEYQRLISLAYRVEYSAGKKAGIYGYYSFEYLYGYLYDEHRGKLVSSKYKDYKFKYYFDIYNQLILTEVYSQNDIVSKIFFYNYDHKKIVYYFTNNKLSLIGECKFNELNLPERYIYSNNFHNNKIYTFKEQLYEYTDREIIINYNINILNSKDDSLQDFDAFEYRLPISIIDSRKQSFFCDVNEEYLYSFLKKRIIEIIQSWEIENGYAISILINGDADIILEYNEDKAQPLNSKKRWNYIYWNLGNYNVLTNLEEREMFRQVLIEIDNQKRKDYSLNDLIDNPIVINILIKIINEIRYEEVILNKFKKEVPILIHDLELSNISIALTKQVNEKKLIADFIKWYKNDFHTN